MYNFFEKGEDKARMAKIFIALGTAIALFFAMRFINEVKQFSAIGRADAIQSVIDVQGEGEAFAIPDVAQLGFAVEEKGETIAQAQSVVTEKIDEVLMFLEEAGIAEKDIKTVNYSVYPEYLYQRPCYDAPCPPAQEPQLTGYKVRQGISVKVRNTAEIGTIVEGIATRGITTMTGPDFTVDDLDKVQAEARAAAIADAKEKARILAKDLGVRLVRVINFSESNGGQYYPQANLAREDVAYGGATASAPSLPQGENKYTSNVIVSYEIR